MKFMRRTQPCIDATELQTRRALDSEAERVSHVLAQAFELPTHPCGLFVGAVGAEDWYFLIVERRERIVAVGALYVRGEDGYLAFAGTEPNSRRLGGQQALMAARIELARQLECKRVFSETGLPIDGKTSSSYRNMLRLGFDELCVRDNFAPEGTVWKSLPSWDAGARSAGSPPPSTTRSKALARSGS